MSRIAPKDIWDPKWIGVVSSYPKTAELFEKRKSVGAATLARLRAEGRPPSRLGVANGWGERKAERKKLKLKAKRMAKRNLQTLIDEGIVSEDMGNAVLLAALEIINNPSEGTGDRIKAMKLVADFTKQRPTQKIEATVSQAEAWLTSLADQK